MWWVMGHCYRRVLVLYLHCVATPATAELSKPRRQQRPLTTFRIVKIFTSDLVAQFPRSYVGDLEHSCSGRIVSLGGFRNQVTRPG